MLGSAFLSLHLGFLTWSLVDSWEFTPWQKRWARGFPTKAPGLAGFHCISSVTKLIKFNKKGVTTHLSRWNFLEIPRALVASSPRRRVVVQGAALMKIGSKRLMVLPMVTCDFLFELGMVILNSWLSGVANEQGDWETHRLTLNLPDLPCTGWVESLSNVRFCVITQDFF